MRKSLRLQPSFCPRQGTAPSRFSMCSGAAGNPATLQKLAELAEADPAWRNRPADLPGLGKTSDFLRLPVTQNNVVHILGAYGGYKPFGAQFFYVILGKDHAPQLGYLVARSLFEDDPQDVARDAELKFQTAVAEQQALPTPASEITLGGDLSFGVKDLSSTAMTHIYQVTVREDTSRALYWLAIDDQQDDGRPLFSMTKLASNV